MALETRAFHPQGMDYNKDLLLTTDGRASLLSKTEHHSFSDIKPIMRKNDVGHAIYRENLQNGYQSEVIRDKWLIQGAEAKADGVKLDSCNGKTDLTRWVTIKDNGTELDLLIKDGKVVKFGPEGFKIGEDLTKLSPLTRKWLKKVIDVLGKIK